MTLTYEQVSEMVDISKLDVESDPKYILLYRGNLKNYWDSHINKSNTFSLCVLRTDVDNMDFAKLKENMVAWATVIAVNNFIQIDNEGRIVSQYFIDGDGSKIKDELVNKSRSHYVFFFGEEGITRYINGIPYEDKNIFYSQEDRIKYKKKKDISQLYEVIQTYSNSYVSQQVNYMCFFADNPTLRQLPDGDKLVGRNILKNKPEHFMRDQLRQYLTDNMQYTFLIEPELGQSKRELDIYFEVKGSWYFIEIKWLGTSINDSGTGLSQTYSNARARDGVTQSLEYIEELNNTQEIVLRHGYLAIFDARDKKSELDFDNYSFVRSELKPYLSQFGILPLITLQKKHPA